MKLLNPKGNMIKMSFRTAKSGHNIPSSLSLTGWEESRSSRRLRFGPRILNFLPIFLDFKMLLIRVWFGFW